MTDRFTVNDTPLVGLRILERKVITDGRGFLERLFCDRELAEVLTGRTIKQINRTRTVRRGAVRGMHFQLPPFADAKFVTCIRGKVFDVAVDVRFGSPTLLKWHGEILSDANPKTLFIPEGFAHGFQTLCEDSELLYFHTSHYQAESEGGLNIRDPIVSVSWPETITDLSERDAGHAMLPANFEGIRI